MALDARGDLVRDTYDVYAVDDGVGAARCVGGGHADVARADDHVPSPHPLAREPHPACASALLRQLPDRPDLVCLRRSENGERCAEELRRAPGTLGSLEMCGK